MFPFVCAWLYNLLAEEIKQKRWRIINYLFTEPLDDFSLFANYTSDFLQQKRKYNLKDFPFIYKCFYLFH